MLQLVRRLSVAALLAAVTTAGAPDGTSAQGAARPGGESTGRPADVEVRPEQNIQAQIDAYPPGTTFHLQSGTYRVTTPLVPKTGQVLVGEGHVVVSGARLLGTFVRSGSYWVAPDQSQEGLVIGEGAVCSPEAPRCARPEDLFMDDVVLRHVPAVTELRSGTWYFDYAADRIYLADDPAGRTVETSVTPFAFESGASAVTLRGLTVEKFASPTHEAAINGKGAGWVIEDCDVRWNHFAGIRTTDGALARRNTVHHNGAFGFIGSGRGIRVENNEISYNNTLGYDAYWGAGGSKWVYTGGLVVRDNFSHHNAGPGLWTDMNNVNVLYEENRVEDNGLAGILHEVSYSAVIRNNTVSRNGGRRPYPYWVDGAGILVSGSSNVEVYGNTLIDNWQGIAGLEGHRGSGNAGPWELRNVYVHDNAITQMGTLTPGSGRSGIVDTAGVGAFSANNRWVNNTYRLPSDQLLNFVWMGIDISAAAWQRYGHDVGGTFLQ